MVNFNSLTVVDYRKNMIALYRAFFLKIIRYTVYNFLKVATQNFVIFPKKSIFGDFFLSGGKSIFTKMLREKVF